MSLYGFIAGAFDQEGDRLVPRDPSSADVSMVKEFVGDRFLDPMSDDPRRRKAAKRRQTLYRDGGDDDMRELIRKWFTDKLVQQLREEFVAYAKFNNFLRRVVHEASTTYLEPAMRQVEGDNNNVRYQLLLTLSRMNEAARHVDRMMTLHNDVLWGFRVRDEVTRRQPLFDVVTPDRFFAIPHPRDATFLIGVGIWKAAPGAKPTERHWELWDNTYVSEMDESGSIISWRPHGIGRMPWLLASATPPSHRGMLLDAETGEDLIAAHLSVWLENVLLLKESKSANRQVMLSGDTSRTATGQSADTETDIHLGEGVAAQTVDRGINLAQFRDSADHIEERAAGNRGIPPAILRHQGASSGFEIELRMLPLKTIRQERIMVLREIEREMAGIMAAVAASDMPSASFRLEQWSIDFAEVTLPLSPTDRTAAFVADRKAGLTNTIDELMRRNPDLTVEDAEKLLAHHARVETDRGALMRELSAENAPPGAEPGTPTPAENGRAGLSVVRDDDDGGDAA